MLSFTALHAEKILLIKPVSLLIGRTNRRHRQL
jgi:hypothetical protein